MVYMKASPGCLKYLLPRSSRGLLVCLGRPFLRVMNRITLIGNLGKDPEVKQGSNGEYITFSLAVTMKKDDTQWFRCVVWPDRIQALKKFMQWIKKGSMICVDGRLEKPTIYQGNNGQSGVNLTVTVTDLSFVPGKKSDGESNQKSFDSGSIQQGQSKSVFEEEPDLPF